MSAGVVYSVRMVPEGSRVQWFNGIYEWITTPAWLFHSRTRAVRNGEERVRRRYGRSRRVRVQHHTLYLSLSFSLYLFLLLYLRVISFSRHSCRRRREKAAIIVHKHYTSIHYSTHIHTLKHTPSSIDRFSSDDSRVIKLFISLTSCSRYRRTTRFFPYAVRKHTRIFYRSVSSW